jgi:hypothetical protein
MATPQRTSIGGVSSKLFNNNGIKQEVKEFCYMLSCCILFNKDNNYKVSLNSVVIKLLARECT